MSQNIFSLVLVGLALLILIWQIVLIVKLFKRETSIMLQLIFSTFVAMILSLLYN